jgi:hypothetical protein
MKLPKNEARPTVAEAATETETETEIETATATATATAKADFKLNAVRKQQIMQQLAKFTNPSARTTKATSQSTHTNKTASSKSASLRARTPARTPQSSARGQQERQIDLQIWLLHQAMVHKLLAEPHLVPEYLAKLEQQLAAGQIRHGAYLFWSCAFADFAKPDLFRASLLSTDPSAYKYRRRTLLTGLLTEAERQQALLAPLPE